MSLQFEIKMATFGLNANSPVASTQTFWMNDPFVNNNILNES